MTRLNRHNVRTVLRALSNYTIHREGGATVITINLGVLTIIIKIPP